MAQLKKLLEDAASLPPQSYELWEDTGPSPEVVVPFLEKLIEICEGSKTMQSRVRMSDMSGTVAEVYTRLNTPGHPVREGMILYGINALD